MKLKIIIKSNDSKSVPYTFTKDEARIKFPRHVDENIFDFCQNVTNYLKQENQEHSLRGSVLIHQDKLILNIKNHSKKERFTFVWKDEKIEEIKINEK